MLQFYTIWGRTPYNFSINIRGLGMFLGKKVCFMGFCTYRIKEKNKKVGSMKKVLVILFVSFVLIGCATTPGISFENKYQKIIEIPGKTQDELYRSANEFFVGVFNSAEQTIQYQDKEEGIIKGKGKFREVFSHNYDFIITVEAKDGKVRITFTDMKWGKTGDALADLAMPKWSLREYENFCTLADPLIQQLENDYLLINNSDW